MTLAALVQLSIIGLFAFVVLVAPIVGGRAEKIGAALLAAGTLLNWVAQALGGRAPLPALFTIDLLVAIGFFLLATRYPQKLWPGVAGCAQFLVFVFSATRVVHFPLSETAYLVAMSIASVGVLLALGAGAWAHRWLTRKPDDWEAFAESIGNSPPTGRGP